VPCEREPGISVALGAKNLGAVAAGNIRTVAESESGPLGFAAVLGSRPRNGGLGVAAFGSLV